MPVENPPNHKEGRTMAETSSEIFPRSHITHSHKEVLLKARENPLILGLHTKTTIWRDEMTGNIIQNRNVLKTQVCSLELKWIKSVRSNLELLEKKSGCE